MSGPPPPRRKYDTYNPSALPTANVGRGRIALDKDGKDLLEVQYETWNKRLDEEVGNMAKGLQELVELSNVSFERKARGGACFAGGVHGTSSYGWAAESFRPLSGQSPVDELTADRNQPAVA